MKKSLFFVLCSLLLFVTSCKAAPRLVYNGDTLEWNTDWEKRLCGTLDIKANIIEVSGIACSRVTPGYIWMQSDERSNYIVATDEQGATRAVKVKLNKTIRWDWEDMSGGVYNDTNYLFIGAFGDNDETDGNYSIIYFKEPAIDPATPEMTIAPSVIKFVYPDGKKHNCEALMFDNIEQKIYIITKVYYNVCQVFSIPFRLDYGDEEQTLTYECDLGVRSDLGGGSQPYKGFHLVTAADISPDGKYILIKNHNNIVATYTWTLLFTREDGESVGETLRRQTHPEPLKCYNYEWQGEAICWLDSTTFYTTSDADDGNPPIYKYTKKGTSLENISADKDKKASSLIFINGSLFIRNKDGLYSLDGRRVK